MKYLIMLFSFMFFAVGAMQPPPFSGLPKPFDDDSENDDLQRLGTPGERDTEATASDLKRRRESLEGVFTRNYPELAQLAAVSPQRGQALIDEARALDPRLREMYRRQYETGAVPTPVKATSRAKKPKTSPMSQEEVAELHEAVVPQEGWQEVSAPWGYTVRQRDIIINPWLEDGEGRLNIERMLEGMAPIGPDGQPINLHHALRQDPGPLEEITGRMHRSESGVLHFPAPGIQDRRRFDDFRRMYWEARAYDMLESLPF